eukprot:759585-Pelagomonas_calceolata.AAC.1
MQAQQTVPASIKEKETHWLKRAGSPLHHKAEAKRASVHPPMGIWRVARRSRLQNLAVDNMISFSSVDVQRVSFEKEKEKLHRQKRRHIGSKSLESPSPEDKREASEGLVGFWKHAASGHQSYVEYF